MKNSSIHIWNYIKIRLEQGHTTYVPGLGNFNIQLISSHVDPVANLFIPPGLKIVFSETYHSVEPNAFITDGAQFFNVSFDDFSNELNKNLNELFDALNNSRQFKAEPLGIFKGSKGFIQFQPDNNLTLATFAFGLTPVKLKNEPVVARKITIEKKSEPITAENAEELRIKALNELKQLLEKPAKSKAKPKNAGLFPILATFLTVVLLINVLIYLNKETFSPISQTVSEMALGSNFKIDSQQANKTTAKPIKDNHLASVEPNFTEHVQHVVQSLSTRTQSPIPVTDDADIKSNTNADDNLTPLVTNEPTDVSDLPVIAENSRLNQNLNKKSQKEIVYMIARASANAVDKGFYVVAGVFASSENAYKFRESLVRKGYTDATVMKPLKFRNNMVCAARFDKRNKAEAFIENFTSVAPDAWIYEAR